MQTVPTTKLIKPPYVKKGGRLPAQTVNDLIDMIPTQHRPSRPKYQPIVYNAVFDLYDIDPVGNTVKIRGFGSDKLEAIGGDFKVVAAGTATLDTNITIAEATFIYTAIDRKNGAVKLEIFDDSGGGATEGEPPDGSGFVENHILWFIGWDSGRSVVDMSNIQDWRNHSKWDAGA